MTHTFLQPEKTVSNFRVLQHKPYLKDKDGPATPKGSGIEQRENVDSPQYFYVVDEEKCKQNTQINHQEHESAQSGRSTFRRKDSSQADEEKQIALEAMLDSMEWNKKLPDVTSPIPSESSPRSIYGDRELQECAADNIISVSIDASG